MIEKLLTVLPPKYALFNYAVSVERSLNHPSNVVKEKILNTVIIIVNISLGTYILS